MVNKSRRIRWARYVAFMGVKRNSCRLLVGKSEIKRTFGRPDLYGKLI
jgi:hypothetical protein